MSTLENLAREILAAYLVTPKRHRRDRDALSDALVEIGRRDPGALGRAMYAAGFRASDLEGDYE